MCQLSVCLVALLLGYSAARLAVSSVWPEWKTQKYATRFNASLSLPSSLSPAQSLLTSSTVAGPKAALKSDFYTRALK